jgi:FkbM family methyltransferase
MAHQRVPPNHTLSDMLAEHFDKGYVGHAVDVGASDGISVNTTWGLEKLRRWTVLSVEPNPEFWPALTQERAFVEKCACSNFTGTAKLQINREAPEAYTTIGAPNPRSADYTAWDTAEVRVETVDDLLAKWQFPKLDVLCVDVEGTERDVLDGTALETWKPKVVVLEAWVAHQHDAYMSERGYKPLTRLIHNEIYQRA